MILYQKNISKFVFAKREVAFRKNRQFDWRMLCSTFSTRVTLFLHSIVFRPVGKFRQDINFDGDISIGIICSQIIPSTTFRLQHIKGRELEITPKFCRQIVANDDISAILNFHQFVLTLLNINEKASYYQPVHEARNIFLVPLDKNCNIDYFFMTTANPSMVLNKGDKAELLRSPTVLHDKIVKAPTFSHQSSHIYFVKEVRSGYTPQLIYDYATYLSQFGVQIINETHPFVNSSHVPKNQNCLSACKYRPAQKDVLVPEVCDVYVLPASLFWNIFYLPSILYRISKLQLKMEIFRDRRIFPVNCSWTKVTIKWLLSPTPENICSKLGHKDGGVVPGAILPDITSKSAVDRFNLKRLRWLGSSYLWFRTSKYLFLTEATANEGVLTSSRADIISNKTQLLANMKNRDGYIQDNLATDCEKLYNSFTIRFAGEIPSNKVDVLIGSMLLCGGEKYATYVMDLLGLKILDEAEAVSSHRLRPKFSVNEREEFEMLFSKHRLHRLERHIGYKFRNQRLLMEACTHCSCISNKFAGSYERLEFLGDAVLRYLIAGYSYARYPNDGPGKLHDWITYYVQNETLLRIAVQHRLYVYLVNMSPELKSTMELWMHLDNSGKTNFNIQKFQVQVKKVAAPKAFGDLVESIIGAVYVDSGFCLDTTWDLVRLLFKEVFGSVHEGPINYVKELYERDPSVKFTVKTVNKLSHNVTFRVKGLKKPIIGTGRNIHCAKQAAARKALNSLDSLPS